MTRQIDLLEFVKGVIIERGKSSTKKAVEETLRSETHGGLVFSALKYFTRVTVPGGLPVFPALISLSNEAAGGEAEKTSGVGAAISLLVWAADVHDDIIDQSTVKYSKKTVYGKFGTAIAILAGDALLIHGSTLLNRECESLDKKRRRQIQELTREATLEIGKAEAKEHNLFKKRDTTPQEYREIIKLKAVVPETICRIGAILANADQATVEAFGQYGRTFGIATNIRDEFADLLEPAELQNRLNNEVPPLPILLAMQNPELKEKIKPLVENLNLTKREANKVVKIVLKSDEAEGLSKELALLVAKELEALKRLPSNKVEKEITSLLLAIMEGI